MSDEKKEAPKEETKQDELSTEELDQAAGGIIVQGGTPVTTVFTVPVIGAPQLPGAGGLVL